MANRPKPCQSCPARAAKLHLARTHAARTPKSGQDRKGAATRDAPGRRGLRVTPLHPWTVSCPQRSRRRHTRSSDGTAGRFPRCATGLIDRHPMPMALGPSGRQTDCPLIANSGDQRWPAFAGCTSATGSAERAGQQGLPVGISPWSVWDRLDHGLEAWCGGSQTQQNRGLQSSSPIGTDD